DARAQVAAAAPGVRTAVGVADLTDPAAAHDALAQVEEALGGVGLLVNNAGVVERREVPFGDDDLLDMWRVVETNVRGPMNTAHALLPGMLARGGGRVVNINSGAGHRGTSDYTGYAISKGALARLTTELDTQYRERGLRVFDLAPGVVRTDMTGSMPVHDTRTDWTPIEAVVELLVAVAEGRLDRLAGRFLRAGSDTADELESHVAEILASDARRLRLVAWGDSDPLVP
ncbi:short-chain dehydrogenase, partial [Actinotalea fermentans ATCC 43279 = JCM 9966 = DSM 3133]